MTFNTVALDIHINDPVLGWGESGYWHLTTVREEEPSGDNS
ncbi:hypothetical protein [Eubacterium aggregans]|nr:hypothetical protein [Eubacterium aggregans]